MEALSTPKVSVLIPAYNAASTIESAVDSILRQTFRDFELVVVDDGSTDGSSAILDAYSQQDPRVRVIHTPNRGIISALNTGLGECRGELIARMDADDVSHPRRLEMQVALMDERPEISVCSCLVRMFPRKDLLGGLVRYEQWLNSLVTPEQIARDMFVESPVAHPSVMVRREELVALGGYHEHGWAEDYDLWLRYHVAGKRFAKVERMLLCWRQSAGRLTFTDSRYSVENFLRAKAHYLECGMRSAECGMAPSPRPSPPGEGEEAIPTPPQPSPLWGGGRPASPQLLPSSGGGSAAAPVCSRPVLLWGAGKTGRRLLKHLLREGVEIEAIVDIDTAKIGHRMRGRLIVGVDSLRSGARPFVISAVSSHGARELIRQQLREFGYVERVDFVCAA